MHEYLRRHGARLAALAIVLTLFALPVIAVLWMTAVPGRSWSGPLPALTAQQRDLAARLRSHVEQIAAVPHNVRHPGAYASARASIERILIGYGYRPSEQGFGRGNAVNIEATIEPADPRASTLILGAHYDSAYDAPGANDNGSGVASLLELSRLLADLKGKAVVRIRFAFFASEEPPFFQTEQMGSLVYARRLKARGEKVSAMISLETIGYYSDSPGTQHYPFPLGLLYPDTGNFVAFVGTVDARPLVRRAVGAFRDVASFPSVGGTAPGLVQGVDWSDHWSFEQIGVSALMITDTAPFRYPWYHDKGDTPDKLDYERLARVTDGISAMVRNWR